MGSSCSALTGGNAYRTFSETEDEFETTSLSSGSRHDVARDEFAWSEGRSPLGRTLPTDVKRIFLLRHGEAEHNATGCDVPDAQLTRKGRRQASAWREHIGEFGAEVVLVSPLRRAVETACLAFQDEGVPLELCRAAREKWWEEEANQPSSPAVLRKFLKKLPRGNEVDCVDEALAPTATPDAEQSVELLRRVLVARTEGTIAVTCHWGVINHLTKMNANNCDILECALSPSGEFEVLSQHSSPGWQLCLIQCGWC